MDHYNEPLQLSNVQLKELVENLIPSEAVIISIEENSEAFVNFGTSTSHTLRAKLYALFTKHRLTSTDRFLVYLVCSRAKTKPRIELGLSTLPPTIKPHFARVKLFFESATVSWVHQENEEFFATIHIPATNPGMALFAWRVSQPMNLRTVNAFLSCLPTAQLALDREMRAQNKIFVKDFWTNKVRTTTNEKNQKKLAQLVEAGGLFNEAIYEQQSRDGYLLLEYYRDNLLVIHPSGSGYSRREIEIWLGITPGSLTGSVYSDDGGDEPRDDRDLYHYKSGDKRPSSKGPKGPGTDDSSGGSGGVPITPTETAPKTMMRDFPVSTTEFSRPHLIAYPEEHWDAPLTGAERAVGMLVCYPTGYITDEETKLHGVDVDASPRDTREAIFNIGQSTDMHVALEYKLKLEGYPFRYYDYLTPNQILDLKVEDRMAAVNNTTNRATTEVEKAVTNLRQYGLFTVDEEASTFEREAMEPLYKELIKIENAVEEEMRERAKAAGIARAPRTPPVSPKIKPSLMDPTQVPDTPNSAMTITPSFSFSGHTNPNKKDLISLGPVGTIQGQGQLSSGQTTPQAKQAVPEANKGAKKSKSKMDSLAEKKA